MDRRALVAFVLVAASCATSERTPWRATSLSTGALSYSATVGTKLIVVAELRERFALVAYERESKQVRWRRDIGPADYDINAVATDGTKAWVASSDGTLRSYAMSDGVPGTAWNLGAAATAVAVSGKYLATGTSRGVVCLRRLADGAMLHCVVAARGSITDLETTGDQLVSSSTSGAVTVWRLPSMHRLRETRISGSANAVAIASDGTIAIASSKVPLRRTPEIAKREAKGFQQQDPHATIVLWNGDGVQPLRGHRAAVTDVAWVDGRLLSSSWDRTVRRWSGPRSTIVARFSYLVRGLASAPGIWVSCAWAVRPDQPATQVFVSQSF